MSQNDGNNLEKQKIDLIVIGNQNSGKTSLIKRFVEGSNIFSHLYNPTLGISLQKKEIKIDNLIVSVNIWDTAGQQKYLAITKNYFHKADGVLIIFDLTDKNSFQKVSNFWINEVNQKTSDETSLIIIGNKIDMQKERIVKFEQAKAMAQNLKLPYFETSAKTGQNVQYVINHIVKQCLKKIRPEPSQDIRLNNNTIQRRSCFAGIKNMFTNIIGKSSKNQNE